MLRLPTLLDKYQNIYENYLFRHKSELKDICIDNKYSIFQRVNIQNGIIPPAKLKGCPITNIPLLEINSTLSVTPPIDLLVVNCNPSGTDYDYYSLQKPCDVMIYNKISNNPYLNWINIFPNKKVVMVDAFPIVCQDQWILEKAIKDYPALFKGLLDISWQLVCDLSPKVMVVTNAYVRDLILSPPCNLNSSKSISITDDKLNVRYILQCSQFKRNIIMLSGGMISGRHQMDKDSRRRLERDIRKYLL